MIPIIHKYRLGDFRESMMTISKHTLPKYLDVQFHMQPVIEYLHFEVEDGFAWLWALVDKDAQPKNYRFVVLPTGREITEFKLEQLKFIDTANVKEFKQLWHLFEVK